MGCISGAFPILYLLISYCFNCNPFLVWKLVYTPLPVPPVLWVLLDILLYAAAVAELAAVWDFGAALIIPPIIYNRRTVGLPKLTVLFPCLSAPTLGRGFFYLR